MHASTRRALRDLAITIIASAVTTVVAVVIAVEVWL